MSGTTFFVCKEGSLSPFWRLVFIVATFLLIWPPICGSVVWWVKFDSGPPLLAWLAAVMIYAYLFCMPTDEKAETAQLIRLGLKELSK